MCFNKSNSFALFSLFYENTTVSQKLTNTLQLQTIFFIVMFDGFISEHVFLTTLSGSMQGMCMEKV